MTTIGIITVRNNDYHPNRRLAEAAAELGHRTLLIHPYQMWPILVENEPTVVGPADIDSLDVVLPRQGATIGDSCLALINHFSLMGIPLINRLNAVRLASNQYLTLQALAAEGIPIPDTLFVNSSDGFEAAIKRLKGYPVVAKPVSGRQGKGVILIESERELDSMMAKHLDNRKGILIQEFLPPEGRRDIRVLIVGGRVIGAMELKPAKGDFRANYHLSQDSQPAELSTKTMEIAMKAALTADLQIAGVDLILDRRGRAKVIELNYSPGFKGMEAATGLDIAKAIVRYVAQSCH
jgi:ribosomal protein S6--L-glutamate ligase